MKRAVVKIGSNLVAGNGRGLDERAIERIAADVSAVADMGWDVTVVSSGAVAAGMHKMGLKNRPKAIKLKQAAAAVGQSSLMWAYEKAFAVHGRTVGQVLITADVFSARASYINAKNTLVTLLDYGIIPVINENDTVASDEIRFGDNDNLAALVAVLIEAERLVILSDVEGLHRSDPRRVPDAELLDAVSEITDEILGTAGGSGSAVGTGGMYSKLLAARTATAHGISVRIMSGRKRGLLQAAFSGATPGTLFSPGKTRLSLRKGWIAHHSRAQGNLSLDEGASRAVAQMGKSLLPSGIIAVEGEFSIGDAVYCLDDRGERIAKGLINYSAEDVRKIMRKKTSEIEKTLGYKYSDEVIHRDNLVLL